MTVLSSYDKLCSRSRSRPLCTIIVSLSPSYLQTSGQNFETVTIPESASAFLIGICDTLEDSSGSKNCLH